MALWHLMRHNPTLKTRGRQFDNFIVTGGTVRCLNDNLRRQQWQQNGQINDPCFQCNALVIKHCYRTLGAGDGCLTHRHPYWNQHDDIIKWKRFPCHWPFVRGIHRSPVNFPHKGQWRGALMFSLICVWATNRGAGDLRRHCAHLPGVNPRQK